MAAKKTEFQKKPSQKKPEKRKGFVDIANVLVKEHHLTKQNALKYSRTVIEAIHKQLANGNTVFLPKFGKFTVRKVGARTARNMTTGEAVHVKERYRVKFAMGEPLKRDMEKIEKKEKKS